PLMTPEAVDAPFLVPKSMAAAPTISVSGVYSGTPITNRPAPSSTRCAGSALKLANIADNNIKLTTQTGMRRLPSHLSDKYHPSSAPTGPASSNIALTTPDSVMLLPSRAFTYFGPQNKIA